MSTKSTSSKQQESKESKALSRKGRRLYDGDEAEDEDYENNSKVSSSDNESYSSSSDASSSDKKPKKQTLKTAKRKPKASKKATKKPKRKRTSVNSDNSNSESTSEDKKDKSKHAASKSKGGNRILNVNKHKFLLGGDGLGARVTLTGAQDGDFVYGCPGRADGVIIKIHGQIPVGWTLVQTLGEEKVCILTFLLSISNTIGSRGSCQDLESCSHGSQTQACRVTKG